MLNRRSLLKTCVAAPVVLVLGWLGKRAVRKRYTIYCQRSTMEDLEKLLEAPDSEPFQVGSGWLDRQDGKTYSVG